MIKKLCTLLLLTCITAAPSLAQRYSSSDDASFAPKKGQWQVSVLFGSGKFFNENTSYLLPKFTNTEGVVGLPNGGTGNSGDLNRYLNIGSLNNNSLVNIAGIEGKYFLSDNWDINFQFSMNISLTPKKDYVEGDNSVPDMIIPAQSYINAQMTNNWYTSVGSNYYFKTRNERIHPYVGAEDKLVFGKINYWTMCKQLKKVMEKCGIEKQISYHCARHTFGTLALSKGMPIESVSRVLGHTNIVTTQIYAKITTQKLDNDLSMFGNKLNASFGSVTP